MNIASIHVTLDTSHEDRSQLNDEAPPNIPYIFVTLDTSHGDRSPLNAKASQNIDFMDVTLDTSHLEMSSLNFSTAGPIGASALNNSLMSVTSDVFQILIGP